MNSSFPRRQFLTRSALSAAAVTLLPSRFLAAEAPAGQRVFVTAHSFHAFIPQRLAALAKVAGIENHQLVGLQSIGGSKVKQHWELADDKNKVKPALAMGEVDVLTMA